MLISRTFLSSLFIGLLLNAPLSAKPQAELIYTPAQTAQEAAIQRQIKQSGSGEEVVALINDTLTLPRSLRIVFGADDGPLYDPEYREILIPYDFIEEVNTRFVAAKYASTGVTPTQATEDALIHTLFHELGHALIDLYQLPVVGKEEDAVDALANVLLIEFYEQGQETVLSAADLFDLESTDRDTLEDADFWDEHSLDEQRYYSALCHVYGSAPDKYASLLKQAGISEDRAELCISEYQALASNWFRLLKIKH